MKCDKSLKIFLVAAIIIILLFILLFIGCNMGYIKSEGNEQKIERFRIRSKCPGGGLNLGNGAAAYVYTNDDLDIVDDCPVC